MGLFGKKDPCPICGNSVKGLFPTKIEGQAICKECGKKIDLPDGALDYMTLAAFQEYLSFRAENDALRSQFQSTENVSFGFFGEQFVFDATNRLFCRTLDLSSTIFEGNQIKSFVIREDSNPLFEGSAAGLMCYTSTVPDRLASMAPMIEQMAMMKEMQRQAERLSEMTDSKRPHSAGYVHDIPEPFKKFVVEIHCDHPYWKIITVEKDGPTFSNSYPSITNYMDGYQQDVETMAQLARALMSVAFPGAGEQRVAGGVVGGAVAAAAAAVPAAAVDAVAEIQRFKALVDQGILTEEEFAAKKRQLLGI